MRKLAIASATGLALTLASISAACLAQDAVVQGEVKKIDQSAGKITLKHGPITNLDMDAMTMVFRVKEPSMLKEVKVGEKIKFTADRVNGAITITSIKK